MSSIFVSGLLEWLTGAQAIGEAFRPPKTEELGLLRDIRCDESRRRATLSGPAREEIADTYPTAAKRIRNMGTLEVFGLTRALRDTLKAAAKVRSVCPDVLLLKKKRCWMLPNDP